jgi:DNA polymerase III epsilon subunit-like protein
MTATDDAFKLLCEQHTFVVIDVETCPADDGNHIVSIAATTVRQGRRRSTWSTLVQPGVPIANSEYHQLTDDDVAGARAFADIVGDLEAVLDSDDTVVVAHNARFDISVLHLEYQRLGTTRTLPDRPLLDTMTLPRIVGHEMGRSRRLATLLDSFDLTNSSPHDAASDSAATADALISLLRVAAKNGYTDLDDLLADSGNVTTATVAAAEAARMPTRARGTVLSQEHLDTHTVLLPTAPTDDQFDRWADAALECAELRCELLADKAEAADGHANELHARLTKHLSRLAKSADPGQAATLVGALNVLAPHALSRRSVRPWWTQNAPNIRSASRCDAVHGACPDCRDGQPCPSDLAHQPLAALVCDALDGPVPKKRRSQLVGSGDRKVVTEWCHAGLHDLAGYAAWLVAHAFAAEGNDSRAANIVDQAIQLRAYDPRLVLAHGQRLAQQGRHRDLAELIDLAVEHRTTDPAWQDLAAWYARHQAHQHKQPRAPRKRPDASRSVARPSGRERAQRFKL